VPRTVPALHPSGLILNREVRFRQGADAIRGVQADLEGEAEVADKAKWHARCSRPEGKAMHIHAAPEAVPTNDRSGRGCLLFPRA
jgi:hypothetical protein